ncbi:hypothetical protein ACHAPE_005931 [Trichoderma viride]
MAVVKKLQEKNTRLEKELTADTCKIYINHLKEKYEKKGGSKFMNVIKPVVEGLKAYTDGLNTLTKNSLGLSITWSVIQLILKCAGHSHKILGHIAKLIGSRTHTLSLFIEYAKGFIGYARLDEALVSMYMAYLDTCIRAANFLEKSASANFFRGFFWGGKKSRDMEKVMGDLTERFEIVKREFGYAKHQRDHAIRPSKVRRNDPPVEYCPRGKEIDEAEHYLNTAKTALDCNVRCCVIHGMLGVGKTQFALKIAHQWGGPVFWLNAETPVKLKESLDEIARILKLNVEPGMHGKELGNLAKQWLATHNGWLLVYDNTTSFDAMEEVYWPTLSRGSVLVTTRNRDLSIPPRASELVISLSLLPMSTDASKTFLKDSLKPHKAEEDDLERISTLLGGIPLALAHVAECIKKPHIDLTDVKDVINALEECSIPFPDAL